MNATTPTPITSTLSMQEIFNRVATHLLTQNARAICDPYANCMYRTSDGLKCAVGCLISDDAYSLELESLLVGSVPVRAALEASGIVVELMTPLFDMLSELQSIHDAGVISDWPARLRDIATFYNLDSSVIKDNNK